MKLWWIRALLHHWLPGHNVTIETHVDLGLAGPLSSVEVTVTKCSGKCGGRIRVEEVR